MQSSYRLPRSKKADLPALNRFLGVGFLALFLLFGLSVAALAQDDRATAIQYNVQGGRAFDAGQYDRALDAFQHSLELFQRVGDKKGIAGGLCNIGLVYSVLGQNQKALDYYERALAATDESDQDGMALVLGDIGSLALSVGQPDVAVKYLTKALEIEQARGNHRAIPITLDSLAQAFSMIRQFDKALELQFKALELLKPIGNLRDIARLLNNIGSTGKAKNDYKLATQYLTASLELKRKFAGRAELASGLTNLALIYFDQGQMDKAAKAFEEAIVDNEVVSREVRDASQVGEYQDWLRSSLYRRYAHVLINQKKPEEALAALERGRGQGLARQAAQNRADFSHILAPADAKRLQAAQTAFNAAGAEFRKIDGLEFLADEAGSSPTTKLIRDTRNRYDAAERDLAALRTELSARNPDYQRLSGSAPVTVAELKALADRNADTLYLQWAVGAEGTSLLFALSKQEGVQAFVIEGGEGVFKKQVSEWRAALHKRDAPAEQSAAQALYKSLFAVVDKEGLLEPGRCSRLVLVGDGPLLEVPYGALMDEEGKRLVQRFPVAVSGSFGVLTWPADQEKAEGTLLVAADPLAPGQEPLPAARQEGKDVAALFPGAKLLVGAAATRPQVLEDLRRYRILHFATHGLLDPKDGLNCGLLLATNRDGEEQLLEARDLIRMRLSAQLAVLSACDTGEGQHSGGEGLLGLSWAFRAAGCPSIVASLWSVDDESTGQLMIAFYEGLKQGKRKDAALRDAMLAVRKEHTLPFFWAAFQVNGDTSRLAF